MGFNPNSSVVKRWVLKSGKLVPEEQHLRETGQLLSSVRERLGPAPVWENLGAIVENLMADFNIGLGEPEIGTIILPAEEDVNNEPGPWRYVSSPPDIPPAGPSAAEHERRITSSAQAQADLQARAERIRQEHCAGMRWQWRPMYYVQTTPVRDADSADTFPDANDLQYLTGADDPVKQGNTATVVDAQESDDSLDNLLKDMDNLIDE